MTGVDSVWRLAAVQLALFTEPIVLKEQHTERDIVCIEIEVNGYRDERVIIPRHMRDQSVFELFRTKSGDASLGDLDTLWRPCMRAS